MPIIALLTLVFLQYWTGKLVAYSSIISDDKFVQLGPRIKLNEPLWFGRA